MENGRTTLLTAPAPELENLSFALPEPESVGEWIGRLPMANVPEAAGQIVVGGGTEPARDQAVPNRRVLIAA